jgi:hypothetical protein
MEPVSWRLGFAPPASPLTRRLLVYFRSGAYKLLGVPPGTYSRADNFQRKVTDPAALEVNGLSDMSVQIEFERQHSRAPIQAVTIAWWRKSGDEFRAAMAERNRSKMGRMARLKGLVETVKQ